MQLFLKISDFIKKGIRIAGLLEIIVTYILQGRSQPVGLYRIAEKPEALAYEFRQRMAVLPVKVVLSKELSPFQHPVKLFGRIATFALITEHTHKIGSHQTAYRPITGDQRIVLHQICGVTAIIWI